VIPENKAGIERAVKKWHEHRFTISIFNNTCTKATTNANTFDATLTAASHQRLFWRKWLAILCFQIFC
jgi:hypothetical protein